MHCCLDWGHAAFNRRFCMSKCIYCGGGPVGSSCSKSPSKKCVVINPGKCSYCGGGPVGSSCSKSPTGKCIVPSLSGKCSYCGGGPIGSSCSKSPTKKCMSVQMWIYDVSFGRADTNQIAWAGKARLPDLSWWTSCTPPLDCAGLFFCSWAKKWTACWILRIRLKCWSRLLCVKSL